MSVQRIAPAIVNLESAESFSEDTRDLAVCAASRPASFDSAESALIQTFSYLIETNTTKARLVFSVFPVWGIRVKPARRQPQRAALSEPSRATLLLLLNQMHVLNERRAFYAHVAWARSSDQGVAPEHLNLSARVTAADIQADVDRARELSRRWTEFLTAHSPEVPLQAVADPAPG